MNTFLMDLLHNRMLIAALAGWITAQILKLFINAITQKTMDIHRLFGDGGMPSGHSATVTALATTAAIENGLGSPAFAISMVVAIIVMHDAMTVRAEAGKHARALNQMKLEWNPDLPPEEMFKEFLGHTPSQVIVGGVWGIAVAIAVHNLIPPMG